VKRRLILSPRGKTDIDDIWEYSAETWSPAQADRYLTGLDDVLHLLCD
jgi:plasmid stabilization system protein ParE